LRLQRAEKEAAEALARRDRDKREVALQVASRGERTRFLAAAAGAAEGGQLAAAAAAKATAAAATARDAKAAAAAAAKAAASEAALRVARELLRLPAITSRKNAWWAVRAAEVRDEAARAQAAEAQRLAKLAEKKARAKELMKQF
jgi:translation initiation factor IF-2